MSSPWGEETGEGGRKTLTAAETKMDAIKHLVVESDQELGLLCKRIAKLVAFYPDTRIEIKQSLAAMKAKLGEVSSESVKLADEILEHIKHLRYLALKN